MSDTTVKNRMDDQLIALQLSYTTAEIERQVFYGTSQSAPLGETLLRFYSYWFRLVFDEKPCITQVILL